MDFRDFHNKKSLTLAAKAPLQRQEGRCNVVNLQNEEFWREEISHDRSAPTEEMSKLEHMTLIKFKASHLVAYFSQGDWCMIAAICARICLHARAAQQETIELLARRAGLAAMDKGNAKTEVAIQVLNAHVDAQFQVFIDDAWARGFDGVNLEPVNLVDDETCLNETYHTK